VIERLNAALTGRYRIERELGEGGMATVYLAEDLKHDRKVAMKVLRPELAAVIGAERFLAEIRTTANLQHPHILPLFDSGEADGFLYYVMPYIAGESLRERLDREGQLGVEEAVRIAREVADALDYAHRSDIVHRDIKPANILLHDGRPVVSDFGIALAISAAGGGRMTETGLSLGTPHYMSPEQASADRDLSPRSDVYALGCVLYEMLAGQPPHTGPSAQSVLVRILTEDPRPLTELRRTVPPHVAAAVMKAIEKLPADRFESARAFAGALGDPHFTYAPPAHRASGAAGRPAAPARSMPRWQLAGAAGAMALAGFAAGARMNRAPATPAPNPVRFLMTADSGFTLRTQCCSASEVVSPDGRAIAHLGGVDGGDTQIFVRPLGQLSSYPVRGTEGGRSPAFSPAGDWIAFNRGNALMRVPVEGGQPMTVVSDLGKSIRGVSWREDNTIFFGLDGSGEAVYRVPADGGAAPVVFAAPDSTAGEQAVRYPHAIPGTDAVLVTVILFGEDLPRLDVVDGAGRRSPLFAGSSAWFTEDGHIVYALPDGSIMAQGFDPQRLDTLGGPFRIAEGVIYRDRRGLAEFGISRTGTMVHVTGQEQSEMTLELHPLDGGATESLPLMGALRCPRFSPPDGRYVAIEFTDGYVEEDRDIWVYDRSQQNLSRVTVDGAVGPAWSPDGAYLLFRPPLGMGSQIWRRRFDGSEPAELMAEASVQLGLEVSRDGAWTVWTATPNGDLDVWGRNEQDGGDARALLSERYNESAPALSPDGAWLAYVSDVSNQAEVYVRSFPDLGPVSKVSVGGGQEPRWSPDGQALYYRTLPPGVQPETLHRAELRVTGDRLEVTAREPVLSFEVRKAYNTLASQWDLSPDGQVAAFVRLPELTRQGGYEVTLNATARVGAGGR